MTNFPKLSSRLNCMHTSMYDERTEMYHFFRDADSFFRRKTESNCNNLGPNTHFPPLRIGIPQLSLIAFLLRYLHTPQ